MLEEEVPAGRKLFEEIDKSIDSNMDRNISNDLFIIVIINVFYAEAISKWLK